MMVFLLTKLNNKKKIQFFQEVAPDATQHHDGFTQPHLVGNYATAHSIVGRRAKFMVKAPLNAPVLVRLIKQIRATSPH